MGTPLKFNNYQYRPLDYYASNCTYHDYLYQHEEERDVLLNKIVKSRASKKVKDAAMLVVRFNYTYTEASHASGVAHSQIRRLINYRYKEKTKKVRVKTFVPKYAQGLDKIEHTQSLSSLAFGLVSKGMSVSEAARTVGLTRQAVHIFIRKAQNSLTSQSLSV